MKKRNIFTALLAFIPPLYANNLTEKWSENQFISLNLCSDRLLIELARPEQIAAMSPYSKNKAMMLDKTNENKPILEPNLTALLPYLDKTILVNEIFYPQLVTELQNLGVKVVPINDNPQTPKQLFALIRQLGQLLQNEKQSERLISQLTAVNFQLDFPLKETLILSETGMVENQYPQYTVLLDLLGLMPLKTELTNQNFSLEKLLLSQPNVLISLQDKKAYNEQAELLSHPVLNQIFKNRPTATMPMKYSYCFDQGIWQGAEILYNQLKLDLKTQE